MQRPSDKGKRRRRRLGQVLTELHRRLRTEGDTPLRKAASVGLGTWIGCVPVYGLHLALCVVAARLLGLSRITAYLAAHINNPLTAPVLLYVEYGVGHLLVTGGWPEVGLAPVRAQSILNLGRDLLLGSLVVGLALGLLLAVVTYRVGLRWQVPDLQRRLRERTSERYLESGIFTWEYVRSKIKHDPLYAGVLHSDLLPREGRLVDYGCGRGILLVLLATARELHSEGLWDESAPPPAQLALSGVERNERIARVARLAARDDAAIEVADLAEHRPRPATAALLFDVLHYLDREEQESLLRRVCQSLEPGGRLLIREPDTSPRWRFRLTSGGERANAILRGHWRQRFHYRRGEEWCGILRSHGLTTRVRPLWHGTPFSNVLIEARRPDGES